MKNAHFHDEEAARKYLEGIRWPNGPVCPFCGGAEKNAAYGPSMGAGWYQCGDCRGKFTVRVGTVYERSHIPLHKWVHATYLLNASKKGMSAHQLHRMLGITYKSAWFMAHRIRESMKPTTTTPMGGGGKIVEIDETYHARTAEAAKGRKRQRNDGQKPTKGGFVGPGGKRVIISLVERGGPVRSFHVTFADKATVNKLVAENVAKDTRLNTDESRIYADVHGNGLVASHERVKHSINEYARGDVTTNTVEGFFSIFKRGMRGVYQHCSEKHLHRYLSEYDFRFNHRAALGFDDVARSVAAHKGAEGKRLTYRRTDNP